MKQVISTVLLVAAVSLSARSETIKSWDFNTPMNQMDFKPETGTLKPGIGSGSPAQTAGGVGSSFGTVSKGASSDNNSLDNSQWRIGSIATGDAFPATSSANKTAGAEFPVNTSGYENIRVTWDQENSATASRYWRVQYTTNGSSWIDHTTVITANSTGPDADGGGTPFWQLGLSADFSAVPGVNNNPNFGFRIVSEFLSTATGSGAASYSANRTGSYSANGTLWMDMVTVTGDVLDSANQRPQISAIEDAAVLVNDAIPAVAFSISDAETPVNDLTLLAISSNPSLVKTFSFGGSGADRILTVTPEPGKLGTAAITVRVTDAGGKSTESSFYLSIVEPLISKISSQQTTWDAPITVSFTVTDLPGDSAQWVFTGTSSNSNIVANSGIVFGQTSTNWTATLNPVANASGDTTITIRINSGDRQASTNFTLKLLPDFIVAYNLSAIPGGAGPASVTATTVAPGLSTAGLTRGPTLAVGGLVQGFLTQHWNSISSSPTPLAATRANALLGDYFQFAVTVQPGFTASLATLNQSMRRSALNSPMNFEWQYSFNGFATAGVTIPVRGPVWEALGLTANTFTYFGRSAAGTTGTTNNYAYLTTRVDAQDDGNPIPSIDLFSVPALQNIPGGTTITFRLIGWGNELTVDSNTVTLGKVYGPHIRGTVMNATPPSVTVVQVGNAIQISWPSSFSGFALEGTGSLSSPNWQPVTEQVNSSNGTNSVLVSISENAKFFRLKQ